MNATRSRVAEPSRVPDRNSATGGAVLVDGSDRGRALDGLAQLASSGPAAIAQRQALRSMFGPTHAPPGAIVVQLQKLTVPSGFRLKGGKKDLKTAVKAYNKLPEIRHGDVDAYKLHQQAIAAVERAMPGYGPEDDYIAKLRSDIVEARSEFDEKLWGTVRSKSGKALPGEKVKHPDEIKEGSASQEKRFAHLKKNPNWEVVFRMLTDTPHDQFDLEYENRVVLSAAQAAISIPTNTSTYIIAVSRNPGFTMTPMLASRGWEGKLCYAAILPPDYAVDLEAEFRDYLAWRRKIGDPDEAQEKRAEDEKQASRELDVLRMPRTLVLGWAYRTKKGIVYQPNDAFKGPDREKLDSSPFDAWQGMIKAKNKELAASKEPADDFDLVLSSEESKGEEKKDGDGKEEDKGKEDL